jgi:hypothetical protein
MLGDDLLVVGGVNFEYVMWLCVSPMMVVTCVDVSETVRNTLRRHFL